MTVEAIGTSLTGQEGDCRTDLRAMIHAKTIRRCGSVPLATVTQVRGGSDTHLSTTFVRPPRALAGHVAIAVIAIGGSLTGIVIGTRRGSRRRSRRRRGSRRHIVAATIGIVVAWPGLPLIATIVLISCCGLLGCILAVEGIDL